MSAREATLRAHELMSSDAYRGQTQSNQINKFHSTTTKNAHNECVFHAAVLELENGKNNKFISG